MGRLATIIILICMGVIALSAAAVLVYQFGRPPGEALSLSLALMCTMIVVQMVLGRGRDRGEVSEVVERLEDRLLELDEDVNNLEGRLTGVEHTIPRRTREEIDPLFAEIEVLGTLVKQMAEAMSDMETRIEDQRAIGGQQPVQGLAYHGQPYEQAPQHMQPQLAAPQQAHQPQYQQQPAYQPQPAPQPFYQEQGYQDGGYREPAQHQPQAYAAPQQQAYQQPELQRQPEPQRSHSAHQHKPDQMPGGRIEPVFAGFDQPGFRQEPEPQRPTFQPQAPVSQKADPAMRELIRSALNANRVDLFLQPIVTLPQRRVKYYEAFTRIRDGNDQMLEPSVFLPEAIRSGLIPRIDNLLLFRSVQVIRRLTTRNRDAALFCNVSSISLADETFFPGFLEFVRNNKSFSDLLILEFTQDDVAQMGVVEMESLGALAEIGFHFSVDQIHDLKMDFKSLAERGFRYAKLHADYLIGRRNSDHGHIHPGDFGNLLHRYGMTLIASHVETESQVLELLDFDVSMAQGHLFSPPRPVRAEVLQGMPAPAPRKRAS
jgi:cyclic-di-GMP phosphodiesterase TipF (flagellum assembly factor)